MSKKVIFLILGMMLLGASFFGLSSVSASDGWQEVSSDHFIIRYRDVPENFVHEVSSAAEERYRQTMTTLGFTRYKGWSWEDRVKISIYPSSKDYHAASQHGWSGGEVNLKTREIATFPSENGFFDSLLPHELGHIIFREAAGNNGNIPLWLDEGVAMYLERSQSVSAHKDVLEIIERGAYIPLDDLTDMRFNASTSKDEVRIFYREAASLVKFLIEKYEVYRFERLCDELRKGRDFPVALEKAYMEFVSLKALEKSWRRYLNEKHR